MNINTYFTDVPEYGDLCIEKMLFVDEYPILFTLHCKNNKQEKFICSCCDIRNEQRWILTPIDVLKLLELLVDKITIHDIFTSSKKDSFVVSWKKGDNFYKYKKISPQNLPEIDLPRQGFYMEGEGEFDTYIGEILRNNYDQVFSSQLIAPRVLHRAIAISAHSSGNLKPQVPINQALIERVRITNSKSKKTLNNHMKKHSKKSCVAMYSCSSKKHT